MSDSNRPENRLANETSPYLLQHRANPVDWYPWGDEAIERARSEDKPILLSIGYSSCHWCHVMERESFEDDTTAELMNERYVNIKVDREERPDLDEIYMTSVQLMTGQGGWPMTVFLTPDTLAPFYAGTYFPPDDRMGLPSFRRVLTQLADSYRERRGDIASNASQVAERIAAVSRMAEAKKMPIDRSLVDHAVAELRSHYDRVHGGFGGAPKFPPAMALSLLLRAWRTSGDEEILAIVRHTLRAMAGGGMYDQVGGGFHRYSVDERWLVPHFEKMLYDNALLAVTYTEAFQAEGDPLYERIVRETLDWVLEEMITSDGAFASSIDADSEGEEGKFFVWMREEWEAVLGDDAAILAEYYGLDGPSNFENGTWIPFVAKDVTVRRAAGEDVTDLERAIERGRAALLAARRKRTAPDRDDKVLVDWNGLMIRAMAFAGQVFEEPRYVAAAQSAARFILERMRTEDGGLLRTYRAGIAKIGALQTDYAALGLALVDLYESDFDPQWITSARELADRMIADFHDQEHGGFFYVSRHAEIPIARSKNPFDNAVPSGNALAIPLLSRLGRLTGESKYLEVAERTLAAFAGMARQMSGAFAQYLAGVDAWLDRASNPDIAFVPGTDSEKDAALLRSIRSTFVPDKVVAEVKSGGLDAPWLADKEPPSGTDHATVFVCRYGRCDEPTSDPDRVRQQLESKRHSENQP